METQLQTMETLTEKDKIEKVCEECKKKTNIEYKYRDGFFTPKMRSINHLEVGYSKIISNPLTIFLEWLLLQYEKLRDTFKKLGRRIFPRHNRIYGHRKDSRIVGRLTYDRRDDLKIPIHNMKLEFWARTWWGQWRKLSDGHSDNDGYFRLPFDLRAARNWRIRKVQFEIYQTTHVFFKENDPYPEFELFKKIPISKKDLIGMDYGLGTIQLFYWEYRDDTKIPRVVIKDFDEDTPQRYSQGRVDALFQQMIPIELTKLKHLEQIRLAPETLSLAEIQSDYPENLTVCIEKKLPGYTRSDDWFGERMMNGMNKGAFLPDKKNPDHYWIKYFGICNYDHNEEYALPTSEVKFKLKPNGLPTPIEIHLTGPLNAYTKDPWQKHVFTPRNKEEWLFAKRIVRVNGSVSTEVDEHFTGTHLNTEQYAIAAYRNLRLNPVANLLLPHLKEVVLINHAADKNLIHLYLPRATALTEKGLRQRTLDIMGLLDWKGWQPMQPISPAHSYAKAEGLFWDLTGQYVDQFFADNMEGIKNYWYEIYRMSNDLVEHSVPVFLSNIDLEKLPAQERALAEGRMEYYRLVYSFNPDQPREMINGELKVVSPITHSPTFEGARPEDLQNLKDACRYMIMMATFMHTWINEHQYDDLGEILYNCGGLRFGEKESGVLAPESDFSIAPDLTRSTQMLWFTNFLSRTEYGFITKDEERDVNPLFRDLLLNKEKEFAELGVDIHSIESRTNI